jgi:hypothetical protein
VCLGTSICSGERRSVGVESLARIALVDQRIARENKAQTGFYGCTGAQPSRKDDEQAANDGAARTARPRKSGELFTLLGRFRP